MSVQAKNGRTRCHGPVHDGLMHLRYKGPVPKMPIAFADDLLTRAERLASAAGNPTGNQWSVERDHLRSSWTFVGASIDTYFHERVHRSMTGANGSKAAAEYAIPLGPVESMIGRFLANRETSRPRVTLNNIVHDALQKDTFQGATNVERAFALCGAASYWATIASAMGETVPGVKDRLNRQYARRNGMSHEGDYRRQSRPQRLKYTPIERSEVDDDEILRIRKFLHAADAV